MFHVHWTSRCLQLLEILEISWNLIGPPGNFFNQSIVSFVDDLGIYVDADLSMRTDVLRTAGRCFAALRQIRSIDAVTRPVLESLMMSLVPSQLD